MITKENQEGVEIFYHNTLLSKTKSKGVYERLKCRRNGKTKTWKTRPDDFKIPVKYGMYEYFYIENSNAKDWNIV